MGTISVRGTLLGVTVAALSSLALVQAKADDATATTQVAQAPMAMPMGYNWTGFYAGLVTGGGWGRSNQTDTAGVTSGTYRESGGLVGGTVGYNWEMNNFLPIPAGGVILGVEGDISATNITGKTFTRCAGGGTISCQTNVPWFNTDRVRAGVAWDRFFPFITGGLAVGDVHAGQNPCVIPAGATAICADKTRVGWTLGTGVEAKLTPELSLKLDYLHVDFGTAKPQYTVFIPVNVSQSMDVVRIGLNFQFGVPTPPPAMTPVAAPMAPPPAAVAPSKQMFIVFFEFDKSALTPDGAKVVAAAADAFKSGKSGIAIAGYTDLSGTQTYNLALSHRRADVVKAALAKDGVPASAIGESWHGKENPRVPTADGVREPQNRRVEITM